MSFLAIDYCLTIVTARDSASHCTATASKVIIITMKVDLHYFFLLHFQMNGMTAMS